ncbi:MAG: NAD-dependent epimerase/dehydratase family protein [Methylococcales bacterium]
MKYSSKKVTDKRCLVLGGHGFIGSHLVERLAECGYKIRIFDRPLPKKGCEPEVVKENDIEFYSGDFTNESDLEAALEGVDYVFHLISTTTPKLSNENPIYDIETNLIGTIKLLDIAKTNNDIKLIFVSSGGTVYGEPSVTPIFEDHTTDPICSYGISKLAIEKYLHLYNHLYELDYVILRVSNPYGEKQNPESAQGVIPVFMLKMLQNKSIHIWGDGSVARDFIYIEDVVNALITAAETKSSKRIFNVGSGVPVSLNELVKTIESVSEKKVIVEYEQERKLDVPVNCLDVSLAADVLGWRPKVSMQDGLKKTWCWLQKNYQ